MKRSHNYITLIHHQSSVKATPVPSIPGRHHYHHRPPSSPDYSEYQHPEMPNSAISRDGAWEKKPTHDNRKPISPASNHPPSSPPAVSYDAFPHPHPQTPKPRTRVKKRKPNQLPSPRPPSLQTSRPPDKHHQNKTNKNTHQSSATPKEKEERIK